MLACGAVGRAASQAGLKGGIEVVGTACFSSRREPAVEGRGLTCLAAERRGRFTDDERGPSGRIIAMPSSAEVRLDTERLRLRPPARSTLTMLAIHADPEVMG